jgi:Protein of unknown function (DUF3102)
VLNMKSEPTEIKADTSVVAAQAQTEVLAANAASIRKLGTRVIGDVIEIGRRLSDCKQLVGHGYWLPWLKEEFRWSERTARNFIRAYEFAKANSATIADLAIDISSLYLLAAPSTPEDVLAEVLRRMDLGESLPHAEIKRIVDKAHPASASATKRPISVREAVKGPSDETSYLPSGVSAEIPDGEPKDLALGSEFALTRQGWEPAFGQFQTALDALEAAAGFPVGTIIAAIPIELVAATAERVAWSKDFLLDIDAKLERLNGGAAIPSANDENLVRVLREARESNMVRYGRPNLERVVESIWPKLSLAQISELRSGQHGPEFKAAADRLMLAIEKR